LQFAIPKYHFQQNSLNILGENEFNYCIIQKRC